MSEAVASGHSLCGAVSYEIHGTIRPVWHCHCWRCRRWTGHFMAATRCQRSDLKLISHASLRWHHPADDPNVSYGFCGECGASMFWTVIEDTDGPVDDISICAGTLDLPSGLHTEGAIFVADAADYHTLDPNIPSLPGQ